MMTDTIITKIKAKITLDIITRRRSIRKFLKKKPQREKIKKCLVCANYAPSSKNLMPWNFIALEGKAKKSVLEIIRKSRRCKKSTPFISGLRSYAAKTKNPTRPCPQGKPGHNIRYTFEGSIKTAKNAPFIVLVFNRSPATGSRKIISKISSIEALRKREVETISIGCAIQNFCLAAESLGLGCCIICDFLEAEARIKKALNITSKSYDFVAAIAVGYKAENLPKRKKRMQNIKIIS